MLWLLCFLLYFASLFISSSDAAACTPRAVSLPFQSNILANRAEARGVKFEVGSPDAQTIVLLPSASYNDTYIYGKNGLCATNVTIEKCITYRGGLYDSAQSESEKLGASIKHIWDDATANWTTDNVILKEEISKDIELTQFEFGVRVGTSHPYVNQGELGLGMNSTFLNALASGQRISSKTYSFFWGTDSITSADSRDGSLTLGGYDQALIGDAPNTTTKFTRDQWRCREGLIVDLTGLNLQSIGGGTQNIMEESEKLQACVVPTLSSVLTLPVQYWERMVGMMGVELSPMNNGTSGELFYRVAAVTAESATFNGNLSITINDAITVTIPNKQLIFNEPYIASNGLIKANPDWMNIPIVSYNDTNQNMPRLGGMFFSSAYLMVDHDKNEFSIAQVQEKPTAQKLMGIDTTNGCVAAVQGDSSAVSETPGSSPSAGSSSSLSGGAIAGIAIGILALIGIIAGIAFLTWRRMNLAAVPKSNMELEAAHMRAPIAEKHGYTTSEMPAGKYAAELDGNSRPTEVPA